MGHVVMSFKPIYGEQILNREKDCEIRTYFGPLEPGDWVLVYESSPVKAFTGLFAVERVVVAGAREAIEWLRRSCSLFDETNWAFVEEHYVGSRRRLIVIVVDIDRVLRLPRTVTLDEVRKVFPGYRPPMSYRRDEEVFRVVLELSGLRDSSLGP